MLVMGIQYHRKYIILLGSNWYLADGFAWVHVFWEGESGRSEVDGGGEGKMFSGMTVEQLWVLANLALRNLGS